MAKKKQFAQIPRPVQKVVVQTNGDLAIVQDKFNRYWVVNRKHGKVYPETFSLLDQAKRQASSILFIWDPSAPSPKWKVRQR